MREIKRVEMDSERDCDGGCDDSVGTHSMRIAGWEYSVGSAASDLLNATGCGCTRHPIRSLFLFTSNSCGWYPPNLLPSVAEAMLVLWRKHDASALASPAPD